MLKQGKNKLVVADTEWAKDIPDWLREEVERERLVLGLASTTTPTNMVGDAEVCLYLFTRALVAPMDSDLTNAYIYLTAKLMKRKNGDGFALPDFMEEKLKQGLTEGEKYELDDLKRTLYSKRGGEVSHPVLDVMQALKREVDRAERTRKTGQTMLFDFSKIREK